ncbi:hypothetical protein BTM36_21870 [Herbaspirillum sp. VT-16-41]|nr:hypothetical protein BTM36_21870 [Herbaspirillum sp. VT-16-41]
MTIGAGRRKPEPSYTAADPDVNAHHVIGIRFHTDKLEAFFLLGMCGQGDAQHQGWSKEME